MLHAIIHKFCDIFVHDSYTVRAILKNVIVTVQLVTITWAGLTNQIARNVIVTSKFILINNSQPFQHSVWKMADSVVTNFDMWPV